MDRRTSFEMFALEPQHGDNGPRPGNTVMELGEKDEASKAQPIFEMSLLMKRKRTTSFTTAMHETRTPHCIADARMAAWERAG